VETANAPGPAPPRDWSLLVERESAGGDTECQPLVVVLPWGELHVRGRMHAGTHVGASSSAAAAEEGAPLFSLMEVFTSLSAGTSESRGQRSDLLTYLVQHALRSRSALDDEARWAPFSKSGRRLKTHRACCASQEFFRADEITQEKGQILNCQIIAPETMRS